MNPSLFLVTIPTLFDMMCSTKSNWLLIKLIKLLTEMYKVEPRLAPKLRAKFIEMLSRPLAKSVELEVLKAAFVNFAKVEESEDNKVLLEKGLERLRSFLKSGDPNLHYLGLEALYLLIKQDSRYI